MVNGAGLAMATMDIIKLYGGEPANFLDVGGGATKEQVTAAFKIILSDPNVKGILVNIFGGIMKCDVIAEGVIAAAREVSLTCRWSCASKAPTSSWARRCSRSPALPIITADDLDDAAEEDRRQGREARGIIMGPDRLFSSTRTPRSSARASPGKPARSTPSRRSPTAPRWSAASRPARAAPASRPAGVRHRREAVAKTGANAS
jgi:hypothetical protein